MSAINCNLSSCSVKQLKNNFREYLESFESLSNFLRSIPNDSIKEYSEKYSKLIETLSSMKSGDKVEIEQVETKVNGGVYYSTFLAIHGVSQIISSYLQGEKYEILRDNFDIAYKSAESINTPDDISEVCLWLLDDISNRTTPVIEREAPVGEEFKPDEPLVPWVNKPVVDQSWSFERVFRDACPPGWECLFNTPQAIAAAIKNDRLIGEKFGGESVPLKCDLLRAFELTPLNRVKVVIVGQDPYHTIIHGIPQATGMSFSTRKETDIQPSLKNIYTELSNTIPEWTRPKHGDLTEWALQGVLLLNTCLTTSPGIAGAHKSIWKGIINDCIKLIREKRPDTVFILWGAHAQSLAKNLGNLYYISGGHPSPINRKGDFMGGDYFNKANEHLKSKKIIPVDWTLSD